jgi:hypothetical protein
MEQPSYLHPVRVDVGPTLRTGPTTLKLSGSATAAGWLGVVGTSVRPCHASPKASGRAALSSVQVAASDDIPAFSSWISWCAPGRCDFLLCYFWFGLDNIYSYGDLRGCNADYLFRRSAVSGLVSPRQAGQRQRQENPIAAEAIDDRARFRRPQ